MDAGSAGGGDSDPFFQGRWVIDVAGNADGAARTWVIPNWLPTA